MKESCSHTW